MAIKLKGIDISYHEGTIDFKKVLQDGIKFIVIRQGYRKTIDKKFIEYVKECKKYNIPIMTYHFIYTDGATIKENAISTFNNLKKANLDPANTWIAADLEYDTWKKNGQKCTKERCTKYTLQYLKELEKLGCKKLFIYMNDDYYENYYDINQIKKYPIWLANFSRTTPKHNCIMFQYSEKGRVKGINSYVDMNYLYDEGMLSKISTITTTITKNIQKEEGTKLNTTVKQTGEITANLLNVRTWAGMQNSTVSFSPLPKGTKLGICDSVKAKDGVVWYYIKYNDKYGFVSSKFIKTTGTVTQETKKTTTTTATKTTSQNDKYINSKTTHYISNCSKDEKGRLSGGKAGDQSGSEWCLKAWYNRPWNYVLRHPQEKVRLKLADLGIKAALNNKIGYDQGQRNSYWTQLKNNKYDPSKITTACEADCSAGVIANTRAVGQLLDIDALKNLGASYTGDMRSGFKKAGFKVLTDKKYTKGYDYLLPGDILLYEGHHTATNITKGKKA